MKFIADFLIFLFRIKKLSVSSVKGYRSMFAEKSSNTIKN